MGDRERMIRRCVLSFVLIVIIFVSIGSRLATSNYLYITGSINDAEQSTRRNITKAHTQLKETQPLQTPFTTITVTETVLQTFVPEYLSDVESIPIRDYSKSSPHVSYDEVVSEKQAIEIEHTLASNGVAISRNHVYRSLYGMDGERSWLDHINRLPAEGLFPFTHYAQTLIHEHQNPKNCSGKRFFTISYIARNGMGSALHIIGEFLGYAMYHDRILIYNETQPPLMPFVDDQTCTGSNPFKCIFHELSSCQNYATSQTIDAIVIGFHVSKEHSRRFPKIHGLMPRHLGLLLQKSFPDIAPNAMKLWWRSQALAYVMRLRQPVLEDLAHLRTNSTLFRTATGVKGFFNVPFPIPPQTWSMHVRHGDKGGEMKLVPFSAFVGSAENHARTNPLMMRKWAFVSSEDAAVFQELGNITNVSPSSTTSNGDWHWIWSNIQRMNTGPFEQLAQSTNRTKTSISWLSQALLSIECDGFVGTRNSNWNRLIDELRGIWVPNARGPYIEVSRDKDWNNYGY